jgi:hypothetical protein
VTVTWLPPSYANIGLLPFMILASTDCVITFLVSLLGNIESIFFKRHIFGKISPQSLLTLQGYLANPLRVILSLPLVILKNIIRRLHKVQVGTPILPNITEEGLPQNIP